MIKINRKSYLKFNKLFKFTDYYYNWVTLFDPLLEMNIYFKILKIIFSKDYFIAYKAIWCKQSSILYRYVISIVYGTQDYKAAYRTS